MKNTLLQETIEALHENNKGEKDVKWVGKSNLYFTWEDFKESADIEYDSGYGTNEISIDLMIVGKNWYLEREEYDGSEGWKFCQVPNKPNQKIEGAENVSEQILAAGYLF